MSYQLSMYSCSEINDFVCEVPVWFSFTHSSSHVRSVSRRSVVHLYFLLREKQTSISICLPSVMIRKFWALVDLYGTPLKGNSNYQCVLFNFFFQYSFGIWKTYNTQLYFNFLVVFFNDKVWVSIHWKDDHFFSIISWLV